MPRSARILVALLWLALLGAAFAWGRSQGYGIADLARLTYEHIAQHPYAPVAYVVIFCLRTLVFIPALWLIILAGSLFGFWSGLACALIGANLSASLGYGLGRFFARDEDDEGMRPGPLGRWRELLDEQAFSTVLVLRVIYSPFDVVNYGCGLLAVPWPAYALATLAGLIPSIVTLVSVGASVDIGEFLSHPGRFSPDLLFDARQLAISGSLLLASLVIAWVVHRRHQRRATP